MAKNVRIIPPLIVASTHGPELFIHYSLLSSSLSERRAVLLKEWCRRGEFGHFVLTAKHSNGFCLWPSALTNYSVAASSWLGGAGYVVAELAAAARAEGVRLGLYLSSWDRHEPVYGDTVAYNEHYMGQMTEMLTRDRSGNMHVKELRGSGLKELSTATARAAAQNVFGKMLKRINRSSRIFPWGSADHL